MMAKLGQDTGEARVKDWFTKTMAGNPDTPDGAAIPPLERFVMELFRTISPNGGSISAIRKPADHPLSGTAPSSAPTPPPVTTPSNGPTPTISTPTATAAVPTSQDIDEARIHQMGLASCPFDPTSFEVKDGRKAACTTAPSAPCSASSTTPYRSATMQASHLSASVTGAAPVSSSPSRAFEDLLRKTWNDKLQFVKFDNVSADKLPIGPNTHITDDIGFVR